MVTLHRIRPFKAPGTLGAFGMAALVLGVAEVAPGQGIRDQIPDSLRSKPFLTLELWQWIGLVVLIGVAVAGDFLSRRILKPLVHRLVGRYLAEPSPDAVLATVRSAGLAIAAILFLLLLPLLGLEGKVLSVLSIAGKIVLIVGLVWAFWTTTDLISKALLDRARGTRSALDDMIIPLCRKTAKIFVVALGLIYLADSLNVALAPLLASFGLAGLAVSFAARDTIQNLFGGLTIFLDHPFKIGDRILFGGYDGVIEEIRFRSTKLRTGTGHVVTIPNGKFTNDAVENASARPSIRRTLNLSIARDTPREKIAEAVDLVRGILEEEDIRDPIHPTIEGDDFPPRVYFNDFTDDGLNLFAIYWFAPPAYWDYLEHAQALNLRILEEFEKAGIGLARPTQTLHLADARRRELKIEAPGEDAAPAGTSPRSRPAAKKKKTGGKKKTK